MKELSKEQQNGLNEMSEQEKIIGKTSNKKEGHTVITVRFRSIPASNNWEIDMALLDYIVCFGGSPLFHKGIKLWGSYDALVIAMGENAVKAVKWYNRFFNRIKGLFNKKQSTLNKLTKQLLEIKRERASGTPTIAEIWNNS